MGTHCEGRTLCVEDIKALEVLRNEVSESSVGVLFISVLATEKTTSKGCGIHRITGVRVD